MNYVFRLKKGQDLKKEIVKFAKDNNIEAGIIKCDNVSSSDIIILPMCEDYSYVYNVSNILKDMGYSINICYTDKGFKQKIRYAERLNNKYAIIIGDDEVNNNEVSIKNLSEYSQEKISLKDLKKYKFML